MLEFDYTARSYNGELVSGSLDAEDAKSAKKELFDRNLIPLKVFKKKAKKERRIQFSYGTKVTLEDLMLFNQQLQIAYGAGIPILDILEIIQEQTDNAHLKKVVGLISQQVGEGVPLSEALQENFSMFDDVSISLVKAGEATGQLDIFLDRVVHMLEAREENKAKIKSATMYPKVIIGVMFLVFFGIFTFVMPKLKGMFSGLGGELPAITEAMLNISDFLLEWWFVVLLAVGAMIAGYKLYAKTQSGKERIDRIVLKMPIIGRIYTLIELSSFCSVISSLLRSGIPVLDAISLSKNTLQNSVFREDISQSSEVVRSGGSLSEGLAMGSAFPRFVVSLVRVGEKSGTVDTVLERAGRYYKTQADHKLNTLGRVIEPLLMIFIFGAVFVVVLAVYLPIWKMTNLF